MADGRCLYCFDRWGVIVTAPHDHPVEPRLMTLHIENLLPAAVTDCLVALETCRVAGLFDAEQLERLAPLVACMRLQSDEPLTCAGEWQLGERLDRGPHG